LENSYTLLWAQSSPTLPISLSLGRRGIGTPSNTMCVGSARVRISILSAVFAHGSRVTDKLRNGQTHHATGSSDLMRPNNATSCMLCDQRRLLLEKNVLLDDGVTRGAAKQSRWPSLLALFNASKLGLGHPHRTPPSRRLFSTSRRFQSELDVSTVPDRKQHGGPDMTLPEAGIRRPWSATLSRPTFVAVDIPIVEDSGQEGSAAAVTGEYNCLRKCRQSKLL